MSETEIKTDIKEIRKDVGEIKETLIRNTAILDHHIARTDAAEARLDKLQHTIIGLLASIILGVIVKLLRP